MRRSLPLLALLCLPALAHGGELTLSPGLVYVDNGVLSTEVLVGYRPNAGVHSMNAYVQVNLDRLGWAETEVVPSTSPDYGTVCEVSGGAARVAVYSSTSAALPTAALLPVCQLRVRPHAHTPRGHYEISASSYAEHRIGFLFPAYYTGTGTRVIVP